jgi:TPR repeat protein
MEPVKVGDVIADKYEVTRILGRGGMGLVVAARHRELGELRALKFLLPSLRERPDISARFALEARTGIRIKNEHVARVHDVGTTADGTPFMVMEHLSGQDLAGLIRDGGPLPIAKAADLLLQACEAIAEAHTLGIVHRDLKPSNLFVTEGSDGAPFVKVLDFGISKTTGTGDVSVTGSTGVLGSPLYMSPEQLTDARSVDPRSDVWALGVILYEMLTAAPPFGGDTFQEVCAAIFRGTFTRLSNRRADVPPALEEVVSEALALDCKMRLSSVEAFSARLAPFGTDAARSSYEKTRRIVARASLALGRPSDGAGGGPAPEAGVRGAGTAPGHSTESALARSEDTHKPRPGRRNRWRWAAGIGVSAAAVFAVLFPRVRHAWSGAAPVGCTAGGVAACEAKCATKDPRSCYALARILDDGTGVPRDIGRAVTLYQSACEGGVPEACSSLGALYAEGDGVMRDDAKAVELYQRSCNHGYARACVNLGAMHFEGKGVPKNESAGARLFFRGCEGGEPMGCFNVSIAYETGQGVPKDAAESFSYAERACAGGAPRGCVRVGMARISGEGVAKDVNAGLAQLDALCTQGEPEGCERLVGVYAKGVGTDVPADPLRVRRYAKKGCELGSKISCDEERLLMTIDSGETTPARIAAWFAAQCDVGNLLTCALLGENLLDGIGVSVDQARGMALLEKACAGKVERACKRLARERRR